MGSGRADVSDDELLRIFALSPDPVLSSPEVAERLPISNQAVNKRLKKLQRNGILKSKKVGSAARIYWLSDDGRQQLADLED
jgi:predicted ArsR family transcriptional regulator